MIDPGIAPAVIAWMGDVAGGTVTHAERFVHTRPMWTVDVRRTDGSIIELFARGDRGPASALNAVYDLAREAIIVDPGDEITRIHRRLTDLRLTLKQILITHAHIDHVGGALKLKSLTGAQIYLNEADLPLLGELQCIVDQIHQQPATVEALERTS